VIDAVGKGPRSRRKRHERIPRIAVIDLAQAANAAMPVCRAVEGRRETGTEMEMGWI